MTTITFIVGIERFNAAVWTDVEQALSKAGLRAGQSMPPMWRGGTGFRAS